MQAATRPKKIEPIPLESFPLSPHLDSSLIGRTDIGKIDYTDTDNLRYGWLKIRLERDLQPIQELQPDCHTAATGMTSRNKGASLSTPAPSSPTSPRDTFVSARPIHGRATGDNAAIVACL